MDINSIPFSYVYNKKIMEINWKPVEPPVYQRGGLYEIKSVECGYIPNIKFILSYSDGRTYSNECNGNERITRDEVKPEGYEASAATRMTIGECVTGIYDGDDYPNELGNLATVNSNVNGECNIPTNVYVIGRHAFGGCKFTTLNINSFMYIDMYAFSGCRGLTSITINSTTPPTLEADEDYQHPFYDTNNCPIYVPANSVNAYKTASIWSWVADRIFPIS